MKKLDLVYYFVAVTVYIKTAQAQNNSNNCVQNRDDRYFLFPDENGKLHFIDSQAQPDYDFLESMNDTNINFLLFTRLNPIEPQELYIYDALNQSNFKIDTKTIFIIHGWLGNYRIPMNTELTSVLLKNDDVNVIVMDWSQLARTEYTTAVAAVPRVGRVVGKFVKWLHEIGVAYEYVHLVGHSLGGHVVGCAGREADSRVRITALDPAGPLWYCNHNRITKYDGSYVEIIHTTFYAGMVTPCGHADYYPNGGVFQPGCPSSILDVLTCSHDRAWQLFKSSILYREHLIGHRCKTLEDAILVTCEGVISPMGYSDLKKKKLGIFGLKTTGEWPY